MAAVIFAAAWVAFAGKVVGQEDGAPGRPSAIATEEQPGEAVRFVHYNLKNWLAVERRTRLGQPIPEPVPKPEREKQAVIRVLKDLQPDILGVCEIGTAEDLAELRERLARVGIELPHGLLHAGSDPNRHLALLSRFPLSVNDPPVRQTYELEGRELPMQRGILDATVVFGTDYRLRLIGLHLKSRRDSAEGDQAAMRRHEALIVREHLDAVLKTDPGANVLVYGDLNETRNQSPIRLIVGGPGAAGSLKELPLADADGERWTFHWPEADVYERIDFAMASPGLWPEIDPSACRVSSVPRWSEASDHRALLVALIPREREKRPARRSGGGR